MYKGVRPIIAATLAATWEAYAAQPFPPTSDVAGVPTTSGLTGQKMVALLRAEYPPIPLSDMEDVRAIMSELIDAGQEFAQSEDPVTVLHGYMLLLMCLGLGLGLRRVPYYVVQRISAYAEPGDGLDQIRTHGLALAELLRAIYPPISDEEFDRVEAWLPELTDHAAQMSKHPAPEISTIGSIFLTIALGIAVGLGKVPISVMQEFAPTQ